MDHFPAVFDTQASQAYKPASSSASGSLCHALRAQASGGDGNNEGWGAAGMAAGASPPGRLPDGYRVRMITATPQKGFMLDHRYEPRHSQTPAEQGGRRGQGDVTRGG